MEKLLHLDYEQTRWKHEFQQRQEDNTSITQQILTYCFRYFMIFLCVSCIDTAMVHRHLQQLPQTLLSLDNCFQQQDTGSALSRLHLQLKGITQAPMPLASATQDLLKALNFNRAHSHLVPRGLLKVLIFQSVPKFGYCESPHLLQLYLSGALAHHNPTTVSTAILVPDCVRQKHYVTFHHQLPEDSVTSSEATGTAHYM